MNRRHILLILVRLLAFAAVAEALAIWLFWHSPRTPVERHYLPAYFWCSLPVVVSVDGRSPVDMEDRTASETPAGHG